MKIHILGIGGTFMAGIAIIAKETKENLAIIKNDILEGMRRSLMMEEKL